MTIATLAQQATSGGGHGFVVRLAHDGILQATGLASKAAVIWAASRHARRHFAQPCHWRQAGVLRSA